METGDPRESAQHDLRRRGYRVTPQRERILQVFHDLPVGTHLSAEELYQRLSAQEPKISLATAYRTLKLLASLGLLREVDFAEGHKHYEINREETPHQHMICVECGQTIEFAGADLDAAARATAQQFGFAVLDVQFKLFGVCASCQAAGARL
jgi:Fur family ferric uptake transcriptional regulator